MAFYNSVKRGRGLFTVDGFPVKNYVSESFFILFCVCYGFDHGYFAWLFLSVEFKLRLLLHIVELHME